MPAVVLVVEDDPVIQSLLDVTLTMEGFTVLAETDGEAGLATARARHPDVAILDVMMPKLTGLEVTAALKADPATASIPIIILSAKAQAADVQQGLDSGADEYLTKPFEPLDLLERVNRLVSSKRR